MNCSHFSDAVAFGDFTLQSAGLFDVFVIKLRGDDGSVLWANLDRLGRCCI